MKNKRSYRLPAMLLAVMMIIGILPAANAAGNMVGPIGQSFTFTYTPSDVTVSFASDGKTVGSAEDLDPNKASTMTVIVPDSDGLPKDRAGEILVKVPENVTITIADAEACQSSDVTCTYRAATNQLVFKWKNSPKAGFTATVTITPDAPSTLSLARNYIVTTVLKNQSYVAAMKAQTRANNRLIGTAVQTFDGKLVFDDVTGYVWTFAHVTGDWYTIANNGKYLNMNKNALSLTDKENATIFHIRKEANGYVIESNGYYLNTKSDKATEGMQGSNWSPMGQWVKLCPVSDVFDPADDDKGYVKLSANGGNAAIKQDMLSAEIGSTVTLPDYTGKKNNNRFIGWAKYANIYEAHDGTDSSYCEVYLPGTEYKVTAGQTTLYAVFNEKGTDVRFGFRIDGKIPHEPKNYKVQEYKGHMTLSNALKIDRWVVDVDSSKPVEGNHVANNVAASLNVLPTDAQIKEKVPEYDPETMYVHWYVLKYSGAWKVDGVIRTREAKYVSYDMNIEGEPRNYIENDPKGFEYGQKATIAVGAEKDGTVKTPSLKGYIFKGWNTEADGSGQAYETGAQIEMTTNMTFYAQWEKIPTYQAAYDMDDALMDAQNETKAYMAGDTVTLAAPANKANYIFAGWNVNGQKVEGSTFEMPAENVTITPEYYGPIYVEITIDWPADKPSYFGAIINLTANLTGAEGLDYSLQWQYKDGDKWVDQTGEKELKMSYELTEETSGRIWRVIVIDARPHQD